MDNYAENYENYPEVLIYNWIQNNGDVFYNVSKRNKRMRENTVKNKPSLWESNWGTLILDPRTRNPHSFMGKRFKRRFRVPFPIYMDILVPMCKDVNLYTNIHTNNTSDAHTHAILILTLHTHTHTLPPSHAYTHSHSSSAKTR